MFKPDAKLYKHRRADILMAFDLDNLSRMATTNGALTNIGLKCHKNVTRIASEGCGNVAGVGDTFIGK